MSCFPLRTRLTRATQVWRTPLSTGGLTHLIHLSHKISLVKELFSCRRMVSSGRATLAHRTSPRQYDLPLGFPFPHDIGVCFIYPRFPVQKGSYPSPSNAPFPYGGKVAALAPPGASLAPFPLACDTCYLEVCTPHCLQVPFPLVDVWHTS